MPEDRTFELSCVVDSCEFRGKRRELIEHIQVTDDPAHNYAEGLIDVAGRAEGGTERRRERE